MFITEQHRSKIRTYLSVMEAQHAILQTLRPHSLEEFEQQPVLRAAAERALHIALECVTDMGNLIIDALIMRDPASYEDIFLILTEERVFAQDFADRFIGAIRLRKRLVHDYLDLKTEDVWHAVQAYTDDWPTVRDSIASYVKL